MSNTPTNGDQGTDVWDAPKLEALLAAAEAAVNRARSVFMTVSIAGVLILSAQFNVSIPWIRNVLLRPDVPQDLKNRIQEFLWKDLYVVSMPILGIKFSAFDLGLIGATALAVLAVWMFYCARRENHVIDAIFREATTGSKNRAAYLYHGIAHHFVFMTLTECDTPNGIEPRILARFALRVLRNIPIWVPLCVLAVDVWTLLAPHASGLTTDALWPHLSNSEQIEVVLRCLGALLIIGFSFAQCRYAAKFDSDTRTTLGKIRLFVEGDPCAPI